MPKTLDELIVIAKLSVPDNEDILHGAYIIQSKSDGRFDWIPEAQKDKIPLNQRFLHVKDCLMDCLNIMQRNHGFRDAFPERKCRDCMYSAPDDCDKNSNFYHAMQDGVILHCPDWESDCL